jgi:hypothetical protein
MNPSRKDMLQRPESTLKIFGFGLDFGAHHKKTTAKKLSPVFSFIQLFFKAILLLLYLYCNLIIQLSLFP